MQVCGVCRSRLEVLSGPARGGGKTPARGGGKTPVKGFAAFVKVAPAQHRPAPTALLSFSAPPSPHSSPSHHPPASPALSYLGCCLLPLGPHMQEQLALTVERCTQANFAAARQAVVALQGQEDGGFGGGGGRRGGTTMQALGAVWRRLKDSSAPPAAADRELDVGCLTDLLRDIL